MPRADATYERLDAAAWLRAVVLPLLVFVIVAAVLCSLVLSGAVQGHRTYGPAREAPATAPTILIEP